MSKIALSLSGAQTAKNINVQEYGIGDDLPFNFFGWRDDYLTIVAQIHQSEMNRPVEARLLKCAELLTAMRVFWGIDAVTLVAEGFETHNKHALNGRDLRQAFIEDKNLVNECLTVTHCEKNKITDDFEVTLVSAAYTYKLGRDIKWKEPIGYTRGTETILRKSSIPAMLLQALREEIGPEPNDEEMSQVIQTLVANGFHVEEF